VGFSSKNFWFRLTPLSFEKPKESLAKKSFPLVIHCRKSRSMAASIPTSNLVITLQPVLDSGIPAYRHCSEFLYRQCITGGVFLRKENDFYIC